MAIVEVKVPQLSESVAEATLLQWKKKVGESVAQDEILIEIETDKVVLEVPAPSAGVLGEIVAADGATLSKSDSRASGPGSGASRSSRTAVQGNVGSPNTGKLCDSNMCSSICWAADKN